MNAARDKRTTASTKMNPAAKPGGGGVEPVALCADLDDARR